VREAAERRVDAVPVDIAGLDQLRDVGGSDEVGKHFMELLRRAKWRFEQGA
jgi:hypothetical protein